MPVDLQSETPFPWPARTYAGKRCFDVSLSLLLLPVWLPLMALIALVVKLTSRGPILYRARRAGQRNILFKQLKFRTMKTEHSGSAFTGRADSRVTATGAFLRFFKLDELPQFINVLKGNMSVVGPRPEDVTVVRNLYSHEQLRVLSAKPGLTCSTEVRAYPDFAYSIPEGEDPERYYQNVLLPARLEEDLAYVDHMCLGHDSAIVAKTIWCVCFKCWAILGRRKTCA